MELRDKYFMLRDCYYKFMNNYFDRNFAVITESNRQIQFNFRQSKLCEFFGIDVSNVDNISEDDSSYFRFTTLLKYKYDYINRNRDDVFSSWSIDVMNSYLSCPIIDGENMQFLVDTGDILYIYVNESCDIKNGKILVLKYDGFKYYIPVTIKNIDNRKDLLDIINSGDVEVISLLYLKIKDKSKFIENVVPTSKNFELFKSVSKFLYDLGLDKFSYSDKDIKNILYTSQFGRTQIYDGKDLGVFCEGRLKMNNNAYMALKSLVFENNNLSSDIEDVRVENVMYKNMILQLLEECNYYRDCLESVIGEVYTEKNKSKGISRILKKDKRS